MEEYVTPNEEFEEQNKKKKKIKKVKNVSVKQCVGTIIFSIVVCVLALIPYTFGSAGLNSTFKFLPLIGNGEIMTVPPQILEGLGALLGLDASILDIIAIGLNYFIVAFFGIVIFDVIASLILIIFRLNTLRIIFKILSIILGIAMLLVAVFGIVYIMGFAGIYILDIKSPSHIMTGLETSGILFIIAMIVFCFFIAIKQFRWFGKRW